MECREAIFVDKSTFDFPIFLLFFNAKFPIFPIFSILSFLFSYFFEQPCRWTLWTWFKVNKLITHITQDGFVLLFTFNLFVTRERGWWCKKNYCIVTYKNKLIFVLLQGNNQEHSRPPMVRVDPERRCSVMLIYGTRLVVLPFRQEGILDDHDVPYTGR